MGPSHQDKVAAGRADSSSNEYQQLLREKEQQLRQKDELLRQKDELLINKEKEILALRGQHAMQSQMPSVGHYTPSMQPPRGLPSAPAQPSRFEERMAKLQQEVESVTRATIAREAGQSGDGSDPLPLLSSILTPEEASRLSASSATRVPSASVRVQAARNSRRGRTSPLSSLGRRPGAFSVDVSLGARGLPDVEQTPSTDAVRRRDGGHADLEAASNLLALSPRPEPLPMGRSFSGGLDGVRLGGLDMRRSVSGGLPAADDLRPIPMLKSLSHPGALSLSRCASLPDSRESLDGGMGVSMSRQSSGIPVSMLLGPPDTPLEPGGRVPPA